MENNGKRTTFIVRELRTYDANETSKDIFYSSDEKAHLNLITCEGVWDSVTKSYPERLIVFSDISEEIE
jgi:sortase (surface protein transpeptidase)